MAEETASEELATVEEAGAIDVSGEKAATVELLTRAIKGEVDLMESYDSEAVQRALALGLLSSETLEGVFGSQALEPWSALLGIPVEVRDVHFNPSKTENGPGFYCVVDLVELESGEASTRHIGGYRPCAQLVFAWARELLPIRCKVIEVGAARQGYSAPLGLELVQ